MGVFSLTSIFAEILGAVGYIAFAGFISYWAHRAQAEEGRAAKMGLYLTFGFLWFILFLVGLSRVVNAWQDGNEPGGGSLLLVALGIAAGIALIPWFRKPLARILPFDGESYPDMIALMFILQVTIALVGLSIIDTGPDPEIEVYSLIIQSITFVAFAYLGVGFLVNRSWRDATKRLGLVKPSGRDVLIAIGCVFIVLAVSVTTSILVEVFQPELVDDLEETLTQLPGDINVFWAAALIGITAAVGEEILLRGAIQPRFGIVFTAAIFALLHVQYGFSIIIVGTFFAGVVFGLERKYLNTTSAIITHMLYNFIAVLANSALAG